MRITILILTLIVFITSCGRNEHNNSVWTEDYEQKVSKQLDGEMKDRLPDAEKRQKLTAFMMKRLKEELPLGIESVTNDSLQALSTKIGKEYGYAHPDNNTGITSKLVPWTPEIEATLREVLLKDVPAEKQKESELMFGCVVSKLKQRDSVILPIPHETVATIARDCIAEVSDPIKK